MIGLWNLSELQKQVTETSGVRSKGIDY